MADPFAQLIIHLRALEPGVRGQAGREWGADYPNYRRLIRASIAETFTDWRREDLTLLKDLAQPPRPHNHSVSIAHTRDFGGWLAVPRPARIGWDAEVKSRIHPRVIERVCQPAEIEQAPQTAYLWPAKEAFFKALEDEQPEVLHRLTVAEWNRLAPGAWTWKGLGGREGGGVLLDSGVWIFAACLIK
jgi:hypothetical protein